MGYREGSEEVVDGIIDASSVYVASIPLSAYTDGSCSRMSESQYGSQYVCPLVRQFKAGWAREQTVQLGP
jgi:hypothetical protein